MHNLLKACSVTVLIAASWTARAAREQDPKQPAKQAVANDRDAVRRAALDYVEALYDARPELIERSVHAKLTKYGFYRPEGEQQYRGSAMSYDQLVKLAGTWNKDGKNAGAASPRKVELLDVLDTTAAVKLTAVWGVDYMQLAKVDGRWQILHILWQSHPPKK